jgi:hypothetical protein
MFNLEISTKLIHNRILNPQVLGPVRTISSPINTVTVDPAMVTEQETSLLVTVPISEDANANSVLQSVEVAQTEEGSWTEKCGPVANFSPKLCRINGLTHGESYWVRVTIGDHDGVNGPQQQMLGPIQYSGLTNLALGQLISAEPGWGCCPRPEQLTDGRIQNLDWYYGFAWTGGLDGWAGGVPCWKHAVVTWECHRGCRVWTGGTMMGFDAHPCNFLPGVSVRREKSRS